VQHTPFTFVPAKDVWVSEPFVGNNSQPEKGYLTIMTYNVWFSKVGFDTRVQKQIEMFKSYDADIIVLQEVTRTWVNIITKNDDIRATYHISHTLDTFKYEYGVFLLFKKGISLTALGVYELPGCMGRDCLISQFVFKDITLCCAVVHLESLDNATLRKDQLQIISEYLKVVPTAILMGDFNFDADLNYPQHEVISKISNPQKRDEARKEICLANLAKDKSKGGQRLENESIAKYFSNYADVWPLLNSEQKGYTYDTEVNHMLSGHERMRYDRIIFKSETSTWQPLSIEIIGDQPIKGETSWENKPLYPSDHFGLVMKIKLS